jgi:phosphoenolpyruvate-protein kinase (PTS system EI component)
MTEFVLRGLPAAPGVAVGRAVVRKREDEDPNEPHRGAASESHAAGAALDAVAADLLARSTRLQEGGLVAEAEILESNRLIALDPLLRAEVERLAESLTARAALRAATDHHADVLASLSDPLLAARAADVRQVGRRAANALTAAVDAAHHSGPTVLVADDLGPADVAELSESDQETVAIVLAAGAATSHAAIMARSLGLPLVVGVGEPLLETKAGARVVVDGNTGRAYVAPTRARWMWGRAQMEEGARARRGFARERELPPVTRDGRWVTLLANASSSSEVRAARQAEVAGVGLLRTELAFLEADEWPTEDDHLASLSPLFANLEGLVVTVRVLDFGSDKTPPFLAGTAERGIELLLAHPEALSAQLRAILRAAGSSELRVMLPLVRSADDLRAARRLLRQAALEVGRTAALPPLGAMIETPEAATRAHELALEADFVSIGTNDLVQYTLALDRTRALATAHSAAHPAVLRLINATVEAAHAAGLTVEVCGESASVPELAALYVGLGVDELSLAPALVDEVRTTIRSISAARAGAAATRALGARETKDVLALASALLSNQSGHEHHEVLDGLDRVRT